MSPAEGPGRSGSSARGLPHAPSEPGAPGSPGSRRPRRAARWRTLLQVAVAAVLLALVARTVPWSDELTWNPAEGESLTIEGHILGDWKGPIVRFAPAEAAAAEPLPEPFASEVGADGVLALESDLGAQAAGRGSYAWRPGLPRVFSELDGRGLALALVAFALGQLSGTTRWWRLLAIAGVVTSWWNALRLTFLGLFFNLVVPGGVTGGDVVKSVIVARENPQRRTHAFVSVYVDRIIGLVVLALFTAVIVLVQGDVFAPLRVPVLLFLAAAAVGSAVYANRTLRRWVRFDDWVGKLPLGGVVKKLDEAALVYAGHPAELAFACLLSLVNHVSIIFGCVALGRSFGDAMPLGHYLAAVPIANTISALPLSPGGWGIGEAAFGTLFELVGGTATIGVAISVTFRLAMMVFGLLGGVFLLVPSYGLSWREIEQLEQSEPATETTTGS